MQKQSSFKTRWSELTLIQKSSILIFLTMLMIALVIELIKSTSIVYKLLYTIVLPNLFLFVIFWWRRNKTNPFEKKRLNRYGYIALITSFIMWISYGSFSIDGVRTYGDIDDVKNAIEISLDELNNEYNELCSEKKKRSIKGIIYYTSK